MEHLPSLFVSHGAPTYALEPGLAGAQLEALGRASAPAEGCAGGVASLDHAGSGAHRRGPPAHDP